MKRRVYLFILVMLLSGCATTTSIYLEEHPDTSQEIKAAMLKGEVVIGMSKEQVIAAVGKYSGAPYAEYKSPKEMLEYRICDYYCRYSYYEFNQGVLTRYWSETEQEKRAREFKEIKARKRAKYLKEHPRKRKLKIKALTKNPDLKPKQAAAVAYLKPKEPVKAADLKPGEPVKVMDLKPKEPAEVTGLKTNGPPEIADLEIKENTEAEVLKPKEPVEAADLKTPESSENLDLKNKEDTEAPESSEGADFEDEVKVKRTRVGLWQLLFAPSNE